MIPGRALAFLVVAGCADGAGAGGGGDGTGDGGAGGDGSPDGAPGCPDDLEHAVATTAGCVVGVATPSGGEAFRGIPYAEPPVGDLRWKRPVPIAPWSEPRDVSAFGPVCPQSALPVGGELGPGDGEEDCLYLNVMRPAGAKDLPVLFFTHGGGHIGGAGSLGIYADDPGLARQAVVVTHNYRLGPLGFLAHESLAAEDPDGVSGNQGLRDTLLALRFARENAAAFGGDPERMLVFGESAGGLTTCALLISPEADGLYAAAAIESAPCQSVATTAADALDQGRRLAEEMGCDGEPDVLACMRAASADDVMEALPPGIALTGTGEAYFIHVDGALVPEAAPEAIAAGAFARVPVVAGANADEGTIFTTGLTVETDEQLETMLRLLGGIAGVTDLDALVALYTTAAYGTPHAALDAFVGDAAFVCPTRALLPALASEVAARGYWFTHAWSGVPYGAFHSAELPYVFGTLDAIGVPISDDERALSDIMQAAWAAMPGGAPEIAGVGAWPEIGGGWASLDLETGLVADVRTETCDFLDEGGWYTLPP